jgi:hypothetical protein
VPPPQPDALLCTILETTECNESRFSKQGCSDTTNQSYHNVNEQNIVVDDTQLLDDTDAGELSAEQQQPARRKSVTFCERLTQQKVIESDEERAESSGSVLMATRDG